MPIIDNQPSELLLAPDLEKLVKEHPKFNAVLGQNRNVTYPIPSSACNFNPAPLIAEDSDDLVHKQSKEGHPALLVPNALLLGNVGANTDNDDINREGQEEEGENADESSLLKLSAMILPPKMLLAPLQSLQLHL